MEETKTTKRRRSRRKRTEKVEKTVKRTVRVVTPPVAQMKLVQCLTCGRNRRKDNGPVTGREYKFRSGEATLVDERDYDGLLARQTNPKRCCGGRSRQPQQMYGPA